MDLKLTLVQHHYCNFLKFTTQSKIKTNKKNSAVEARQQQPKKKKKKMAPHHNITAQNIMNSTQFIYTSFSRLRRVKKLIYSHYMPKGLSQFMVGIRYHIALFKFLFSNTTEEIW